MAGAYIVHKAVELSAIKKKMVPSEEALRTSYLAQPKYDGCCMVAIKNTPWVPGNEWEGSVELRSRTNELVQSAMHIEECIAKAPFLPPGVYFGEYWNPEIDRDTMSGYFRDTKAQHPEAFYVIFDYVTLEEWREGFSTLGWSERVGRLPHGLDEIEECAAPIFPAESQGFLVDQEMTPMEAAQLMSSGGMYDGIILRKLDGVWKKGDRGTSGEVVKIKPTLTLDLRVLRVNMSTGEKTGRDVWTVVVDLGDGKEQEVGSGVPHDAASLPAVGDIVEIEAMSFSKYGLLREPRYKGIRTDKTEADR